MNSDLEENATHEIPVVTRGSSQVVEKISAVLQLLMEKRQTLEEKMIIKYLIAVAQLHSSILKSLFSSLQNQTEAQIGRQVIARLTELNEQTLSYLSNLLQAATFDMNYLEQYFEHDFYNELLHSNLKERTEEVVDAMGGSS